MGHRVWTGRRHRRELQQTLVSIQGGRSESRGRRETGRASQRKILPPPGYGKSQMDGGQNPGNTSCEHRGSQGRGGGSGEPPRDSAIREHEGTAQ